MSLVDAPTPMLDRVRDELASGGGLRGRHVGIALLDGPATRRLAEVLGEAGAEVTVPGAAPAEVVIADRADAIALQPALIGASVGTRAGAAALRIPCVAAGDARSTLYGSGQALVAAVCDATNLLLAGKRTVVAGYGPAGRGIAARARGLGAQVTVAAADPFDALEAHAAGFGVAPLREALAAADVVFAERLPPEALDRLADGVVLCGLEPGELKARGVGTRRAREHLEEVELPGGRSVFVVSEGLALGGGHPVELADVACAIHALSAHHLLAHAGELEPGVHPVPRELDEQVARWKLEALGIGLEG